VNEIKTAKRNFKSIFNVTNEEIEEKTLGYKIKAC
jgi:hypothetical protein